MHAARRIVGGHEQAAAEQQGDHYNREQVDAIRPGDFEKRHRRKREREDQRQRGDHASVRRGPNSEATASAVCQQPDRAERSGAAQPHE